MKFFDLFPKQAPGSIKHVRLSDGPTQDQRAATARKIDAIESEISAELDSFEFTDDAAGDASSIEQCTGEASILYANRQPQAAESLLLDAVVRPTQQASENTAWQMLLEIACFDGDQARFEGLALRYAERFETSPPQWRAQQDGDVVSTSSPTLAFRGKLLGSSSPALTQLTQAAAALTQLTLDLRSITEVDSSGCSALLALLTDWHRAGRQIHVECSHGLIELLRAAAQLAGPASDDAAWRLLIELLRISGDEVSYEDACVAYCLTYERSPPPPLGLAVQATTAASKLLLPEQIRYPVDDLIERFKLLSAPVESIILNGQQLRLIEFNAAAPLLAGIADLARGKAVEWHAMPLLASKLLQMISGAGKIKIVPRLF